MTAEFLVDLATAVWLGFTGACIGSFLNVVAYRMPRGMSVIWKPSHCPHCNHPIRARDNVPVLGWLLLRGKCRDCGGPISPRYAIVEAVMGAAFFVLAYVELFSGGANLSGGPITELRGAADIVWNPQWWVIGVYVFHCLLASVLITLSLLRLDGNIRRTRFAVAVIVIVFAWFGFPWVVMG
jgi:leader peptidase (prepilin peptidase)/N-methyltransferase